MGRLIAGDEFFAAGPAEVFRTRLGGRPVAIVHGTADATIDVAEATVLAQAATDGGTSVTPWILPGVAHVQAAFVETVAYESRLTGFFGRALGP